MRRQPSRSPATENRPHFFKIIHSDVIREGRLRIPTKFRSNFPNGLPDFAKFSVPGGKNWKIKLKKEKDGMWFEKGLCEFIEYYSINAGHLLLFRYDGNFEFHIIIFDMTASEIGYSCGNAGVDVGSKLHKKKDGPKLYSHNPILKCKKEQVEHVEIAAKPSAEKVTSQFEKRRTGKLEIIEVSDGDTAETSEDVDTIETSEDDAAVETSEDDDAVETSEDDSIEILDADTFHKNVSPNINFDEYEEQGMRKLCGQRKEVHDNKYKKKGDGKQCTSQSQRRRFSLRTLSNKTAEVASSRLHKQHGSDAIPLSSTSSKHNHLLKCKKELFESKGKEKQLSDEDNRRQLKHKRNEAESHDFKEKACVKASKTLAREENNEAAFVDTLGDSPFQKHISSRNMVMIGKCGEKGTKFQQFSVLSRSVANGTKSSVGDGPPHYQLQNKSVSCSGNGNSKLNLLRQCKTEQGKAELIVGGSKRSRVTHDGSEKFYSGSDKTAKVILSDSDSSRRINNKGVYPYPCKKFRRSQELAGVPVMYPGKTRGLVDSCETNEVRNKGDAIFNLTVKKEVLEMDVESSEKIPSELAEWRKANLAKFVTTNPSSGLLINGSLKRSRDNSATEHSFPRHSETNSLLFHRQKDQDYIFASSSKFISSCRTSDELLTKFMNISDELPASSSQPKLNPRIDKLLKACIVESDSSKHGFQSQESPILLLNQTTIPANIPMTIKEEAGDLMFPAASSSGNACFQVTMRRSYVNDTFRLNVPYHLASLVTNHRNEGIILQLPDGRNWHVKLSCYKSSYPKLNHGWKEFVLDNHLKEDDVCVFRVVQKEPNVIKVVILRST